MKKIISLFTLLLILLTCSCGNEQGETNLNSKEFYQGTHQINLVKTDKFITKNGKSVKMVSVADKSQPPVIEKKRITFVQIKKAFAEEFAPDILPVAKSKGLNMYDKLDNL